MSISRTRFDPKATAALLRRLVRQQWPDTTFSVRCGRGTGTGYLHMRWVDGPVVDDVAKLVTPFERAHRLDEDTATVWCEGVHLDRDMGPVGAAFVADVLARYEPFVRVVDGKIPDGHLQLSTVTALGLQPGTSLPVAAYRLHYRTDFSQAAGPVAQRPAAASPRGYRSSELAELLAGFKRAVEALPAQEPLLMADLDPDDQERVLGIWAHCPRCGSSSLAEMDWDVRWNHLHDFEFSEFVKDQVCARVACGDIEHETLTWFCTECGQVLDLSAVNLDWV